MSVIVYWFRNDLRLADNIALLQASGRAEKLIPVYCHDPAQQAILSWGFPRRAVHRRQFLADTLAVLDENLRQRGSRLLQFGGTPAEVLPKVVAATGACRIVCEKIAAPDELAEVKALRAAGIAVEEHWQSSLLAPDDLPFTSEKLAPVFSAFRNAVEQAPVVPREPLAAPECLPPLPDFSALGSAMPSEWRADAPHIAGAQNAVADDRASFPYFRAEFAGGEAAASAHLERYFDKKLAHSYMATRNALTGIDYSSKFSPWLASGALSPRIVYAALKRFEAEHGANDGSYWLWFELLWRDYFRFLHLQHGSRLYRVNGLAPAHTAAPRHNAKGFARWCRGETGNALIDAGMRELAATGFLSNRLRQVVASYLVHDLGSDWRAGAAWFESCLLDYDVYSNQGNWLYIAGRGTDPRGGRRFNPDKQAAEYDPDGAYRALWH